MQSQVISESFAINEADVLYVAQQISRDLVALSQAYPKVLSPGEAMSLFISYSTFLVNDVVTKLGFSIYDPADSNLVYHEYRYDVFYGRDAQAFNRSKSLVGNGARPVNPVSLPDSAKFAPWVVWSPRMLSFTIPIQEQIVSGTAWSIPSRGSTFNGRYMGGNWNSLGYFGRASIGPDRHNFRQSIDTQAS